MSFNINRVKTFVIKEEIFEYILKSFNSMIPEELLDKSFEKFSLDSLQEGAYKVDATSNLAAIKTARDLWMLAPHLHIALYKVSNGNQLFLWEKFPRKISPSIQLYKGECSILSHQEAILISDEEATIQFAKVEQVVEEAIERIPENENLSELISQLQEALKILTKLDERDKAVSAKLKVVMPLIPPFVTYELEMDTEPIISQARDSVTAIFGSMRNTSLCVNPSIALFFILDSLKSFCNFPS